MCRLFAILLLAFFVFSNTGCGGGGTEAPPSNKTTVITVPAGQQAAGTVDNATFTAPNTAFPQGGQVTITKYDPPVALPACGGKLLCAQYDLKASVQPTCPA